MLSFSTWVALLFSLRFYTDFSRLNFQFFCVLEGISNLSSSDSLKHLKGNWCSHWTKKIHQYGCHTTFLFLFYRFFILLLLHIIFLSFARNGWNFICSDLKLNLTFCFPSKLLILEHMTKQRPRPTPQMVILCSENKFYVIGFYNPGVVSLSLFHVVISTFVDLVFSWFYILDDSNGYTKHHSFSGSTDSASINDDGTWIFLWCCWYPFPRMWYVNLYMLIISLLQ